MKNDLDKYQEDAVRTAMPLLDRNSRLQRGALGLTGEAGELANYIKQCLYQGRVLNYDTIAEELGDILWYVAVLAEDINYGLSYIADFNIRKLRERYPDGFDPARSARGEVHET